MSNTHSANNTRTRTSLLAGSTAPTISPPAGSHDVMAKLQDMQGQLSTLIDSVQFCSDKITDFEQKIIKLEEQVKKMDKIVAENKKLSSDLQRLEDRVGELEQLSRSPNIEIQGVPEKANENLLNVLDKLGNYINYKITPEKVEYAHRVQLNKNSNNKIKNIIVRFTSTKEKENVLSAAKTKRLQKENGSPKMKIEGLSDNLYINEHLTLSNKILYKEVRAAAKAKNINFSGRKMAQYLLEKVIRLEYY